MLALSATTRIFLYHGKVDMRKGVEGLGTITEDTFPSQLLTGALFIFLNRGRDKMKVLYWDKDGFAIWYKRLEKGTFSSKNHSASQISRTEFLMLLEGVTPKRIQKRWSPS